MSSLIVFWIAIAVAAGGITNAKGRGWGLGLAWGLLGVIGLVVVLCYPARRPGAAAPGWYPYQGVERYWNGDQWSDLPPRSNQ